MISKIILDDIYFSANPYCFDVIDKFNYPYEIWMGPWKAYGDPSVPPFLEDILSLVTSIMVPSILNDIPPPDTLVASTNLVLASKAPD